MIDFYPESGLPNRQRRPAGYFGYFIVEKLTPVHRSVKFHVFSTTALRGGVPKRRPGADRRITDL